MKAIKQLSGKLVGCFLIALFFVNGQTTAQSHNGTSPVLEDTLFGIYNPSDDSYIRGGAYSNDNYNSESDLLIKQGSNEAFFRKALVKFDLSAVNFGDTTISHAVLRLYVTSANACPITASKIGDDWSESTLTWDNAPADISSIITTQINVAGVYAEWDVTSYVMGEIEGDKIISISLFDQVASSENTVFNSKEAGTNIPELILYKGDIELPANPSSLSADVISKSKVKLSWNDNSNNEIGFSIERKTLTEDFTEVTSVSSGITLYMDSSLIEDAEYTYRLRAYNTAGYSEYTNEVVATPNGGTTLEIKLSDEIKQRLRFGIDAERLWYWRTGSFGQTLAKLGVKDLQSEFVRVAIYAKYEREEGVILESAYDKILDMMTAMKNANPDILFFASPRPLDEAYSDAEINDIWNGSCPWAPVPSWIMTWNETSTGGWSLGTVYPDKLTRYYADYVNFMNDKGFKISYLDITNEKNVISPTHCKYLYDNMPGLLNEGVYMPELVAPSAWNYEQGIDYLKSFTAAQRESYTIAACHNTNKTGNPKDFAYWSNYYEKEPWDSELHGWKGIDIVDEVLSSHYFFEHINAGFVGLDTWLFYGPLEGKDHTMLWSNSSEYAFSSKYEIFKKVVNNANGGNYLVSELSVANNELLTTGFIKNDTIMIWLLNSNNFEYSNININFGNWRVTEKNIEVTCYNANYPRSGKVSNTNTSTNKLRYPFEGESLYCFKVGCKKNTAPELSAVSSFTIDEDTQLSLTLDAITASDAEGDPLTLQIIPGLNYTSLSSATLVPDEGFYGELSVGVAVNDGFINSDTLIMMVKVNPVPDTTVIYWQTPASVVYGSVIGSSVMNAETSSEGTFTYSFIADSIFDAGVYKLRVLFTPTNTNDYSAASHTVDYIVTKAILIATANNQSIEEGYSIPTLTISYAGFVNDDSEADLDVIPTTSTAADGSCAIGTYPIIITGGSDNNYDYTYVDGIVTIIEKGTAILWVSVTELSIESVENSSAIFDITSNISWTVASSERWLAANTYAGVGDASLMVTAAANTTDANRTATITVAAEGVDAQNITVTQSYLVGINNEQIFNFMLYPNPANTHLYVNNAANSRVEIFDIKGNEIFTKNVVAEMEQISLTNFKAGIYIIKVTNNKYTLCKHFVIE